MKSKISDILRQAAALLVAICVAFAMTVPAYGANTGPNTGRNANTYIVIKSVPKFYQVHSADSAMQTLAPKGVKYNPKTNTLTLTRYSSKNAVIEANEMGSDFKIKVNGTCNVGQIMIWGQGYGGSLRITGKGTLNINKNKIYDYAVLMNAEISDSKLVIDKTVNINAYAPKGKAALFLCKTTASKNGIQLKGKVTGKKKITKKSSVEYKYEWVDVYLEGFARTIEMFKIKNSAGKLYGCLPEGIQEEHYTIYELEANDDGTYNSKPVEGQDMLTAIPSEYTVIKHKFKVYEHKTSASTLKIKAKK